MMKTKGGAILALAVAISIAVGLAGCGGGSSTPAASPEEIAQGQKLFRETCASCHGPDAEGMPKLGKNLHQNEFVASLDDEELLAFLKQGRPAFHPLNERKVDMPPKGGNPALQDEHLRLIGAYLRSIN